jgi:hypothetical protein
MNRGCALYIGACSSAEIVDNAVRSMFLLPNSMCHVFQHILEPGHREFARDKQNYETLDTVRGNWCSLGDFLRKVLLQHCTRQASAGAHKPAATRLVQNPAFIVHVLSCLVRITTQDWLINVTANFQKY